MQITTLNCDVAVIGGGPGGIPAALAVARRGAKVILAERNGQKIVADVTLAEANVE